MVSAKKLALALSLASGLSFASETQVIVAQKEVLSVKKERAIVLNGPISYREALPFSKKLAALGRKHKIVDLVINSPGGSVIAEGPLRNAMESLKAQGITIRCFVPEIAASLAFQTLLRCDERHVLGGSLMLWHRARIGMGMGSVITAPVAELLYKTLQTIDSRFLIELKEGLSDIPEDLVVFHFEQETFHTASDLKTLAPNFLTVHTYIPGLLEILEDTAVPMLNNAGDSWRKIQDKIDKDEGLMYTSGAERVNE